MMIFVLLLFSYSLMIFDTSSLTDSNEFYDAIKTEEIKNGMAKFKQDLELCVDNLMANDSLKVITFLLENKSLPECCSKRDLHKDIQKAHPLYKFMTCTDRNSGRFLENFSNLNNSAGAFTFYRRYIILNFAYTFSFDQFKLLDLIKHFEAKYVNKFDLTDEAKNQLKSKFKEFKNKFLEVKVIFKTGLGIIKNDFVFIRPLNHKNKESESIAIKSFREISKHFNIDIFIAELHNLKDLTKECLNLIKEFIDQFEKLDDKAVYTLSLVYLRDDALNKKNLMNIQFIKQAEFIENDTFYSKICKIADENKESKQVLTVLQNYKYNYFYSLFYDLSSLYTHEKINKRTNPWEFSDTCFENDHYLNFLKNYSNKFEKISAEIKNSDTYDKSDNYCQEILRDKAVRSKIITRIKKTSEALKKEKMQFIKESDKKYDEIKKIVNLQNKKEKNSIYFKHDIKHNHLLDILNLENRGKSIVLRGKITALIKLISGLLNYKQEEYYNDELISKLGKIKSSLENYKREIDSRYYYSLEEKNKDGQSYDEVD